MTLEELKPGQQRKVTSIGAIGPIRRRTMDMGVTPGVEIKVIEIAPSGDPVEVNVRGYELSLRKEKTVQIQMEMWRKRSYFPSKY